MELIAVQRVGPQIGQSRQCWECLRRRLVCDTGHPVCNKCKTSGIVCPGYDDKKPLRWLTPGKVTSRTRRSKTKSAKKDDQENGVRRGPKEESKSSLGVGQQTLDLVPRSNWKSDVSDVVQAIHYCKYRATSAQPIC